VGKTYDEITPELANWIRQQRIFFVATAPLSASGLVNCSPKGMDSFRILGPREVAYLDLTGSGVESVAHVQENGRIVLMFCAFTGPPNIVRLHGNGEVLVPVMPEFLKLQANFPEYPGARAIVRIRLTRIGDSCGYAVPRFGYIAERATLLQWAESKGPDGLAKYRRQKNAHSIDGLVGLSSRDEE
jgi:hypothetical protein